MNPNPRSSDELMPGIVVGADPIVAANEMEALRELSTGGDNVMLAGAGDEIDSQALKNVIAELQKRMPSEGTQMMAPDWMTAGRFRGGKHGAARSDRAKSRIAHRKKLRKLRK